MSTDEEINTTLLKMSEMFPWLDPHTYAEENAIFTERYNNLSSEIQNKKVLIEMPEGMLGPGDEFVDEADVVLREHSLSDFIEHFPELPAGPRALARGGGTINGGSWVRGQLKEIVLGICQERKLPTPEGLISNKERHEEMQKEKAANSSEEKKEGGSKMRKKKRKTKRKTKTKRKKKRKKRRKSKKKRRKSKKR